jgi:hypothetical protein
MGTATKIGTVRGQGQVPPRVPVSLSVSLLLEPPFNVLLCVRA